MGSREPSFEPKEGEIVDISIYQEEVPTNEITINNKLDVLRYIQKMPLNDKLPI